MNEARRDELIAILEDPSNDIDMQIWDCGTAACIAGYNYRLPDALTGKPHCPLPVRDNIDADMQRQELYTDALADDLDIPIEYAEILTAVEFWPAHFRTIGEFDERAGALLALRFCDDPFSLEAVETGRQKQRELFGEPVDQFPNRRTQD